MKKISFALFIAFSSIVVWAQSENSTLEIAVDDPEDNWYSSPWMWVAGAALIIVLLVVLSQKKEKKE